MLARESVKQNIFDRLIASHVVKADMLHLYAKSFLEGYGSTSYLRKAVLVVTRKNYFSAVI